jgi:hypothetical protein
MKFLSESLKKKIFGDPALAERVVRQHIVPNIGQFCIEPYTVKKG